MNILYHWRDWSGKGLDPWRRRYQQWDKMRTLMPMGRMPWERAGEGLWEIMDRWTRPVSEPSWALTEMKEHGHTYPVHKVLIQTHPFCRLCHFQVEGRDPQKRPKVVVVAPLSGHYATLLKDTVATLLKHHEVYVTEWVNARDVPIHYGPFDNDDYIQMLWDFLKTLGERVHLLAVCQPAVQVLALSALMAQHDDPLRPCSITLMGGPLDTQQHPTRVNDFAHTLPLSWFEEHMIHTVPEGYLGVGRKVYPGFLQLMGFVMLNPQRHAEAHAQFLYDMAQQRSAQANSHRKFYDEYVAVMDMPAEYFLQTVQNIFQKNLLASGKLKWRGTRIDPGAIKDTALLTIEGEKDDITGLGQTHAAHKLCTNLTSDMKKHYEQKEVGHYGLFSGHHWREEIEPHMRAFIAKHHRCLVHSIPSKKMRRSGR